MKLSMSQPVQSLHPSQVPPAQAQGLYVHVPFCFHKCHYCDFYSITRQSPQRMERYVDLILAEADLWGGTGVALRPRTVFFGGGTPTLLPMEQMRRLITGLKQRFDFGGLEEWTIEANPATVSQDYCSMLRNLGVNRLSFGAQSFKPAELKLLERHHEPADVGRSIEQARAAGFERLNVDLIYAIPGQSLESWADSLEAAMALRTGHISCYALTYESNTPITVRKRLGQFKECEEDLELRMMRYTRTRLAEARYAAYEISNYATKGEECRHNLVYWDGDNYIGLGPSGASHVSGWRWKNRPHLGEWEEAVAAGQLPAADWEQLTAEQRGGEWVMLRLRLERGVSFGDYAQRFGRNARNDYADPLSRLHKLGLIWVNDCGFGLSASGLAVADAVAAEFLK